MSQLVGELADPYGKGSRGPLLTHTKSFWSTWKRDATSRDLVSPSNKLFAGDSVDLIKANGPSRFLENFIKGMYWKLCHLEKVISNRGRQS